MRLRLLSIVLLLLAALPACGGQPVEVVQLASASKPKPATALPELLDPVVLPAVVEAPAAVPAAALDPAPPAAAPPWHAEKRCDGKPCGPLADSPTEKITCPATGRDGDDASYTFTAGEKQLDGTCPRDETPQEEIDWRCPPDEWRYDDVRIDYAAEADGCGPLVRPWNP